jgi:hypothetical protein
MSINYITNDPAANNPPIRVIQPHANRPSGRAGFNYFNVVAQNQFPPLSDEFLFWQCREAALRAVAVWESIDANLQSWIGGRSKLDLIQKVANDNRLNAFYDRRSLSFFEFAIGNQVFLSGASTDVVAHEAGHAFLDQIRPDLFSSSFMEPGAFHESFGDCIAILVALEDLQTRQTLIAGAGLLRQQNFVESTAEDLSAGIRTVKPNHNAAVPRRALNDFQWVLPGTLPANGGPGTLINEIHSFGMVFSGCFYDTLTNIFHNSATQDEAALLNAARTTGKLLAAGARNAQLTPRFFRSVGHAMVLADDQTNAGANKQSIVSAFARHNIVLDTAAMLAPTNILAGRAPLFEAVTTAQVLTRASRRDLVAEIGEVEGQRFFASPKRIGGDDFYVARQRRKIPLDDVSERLEGVVVMVEDDLLLGEARGFAAVLGEATTNNVSTSEVQSFVNSLVQNDQVEFKDGRDDPINSATHVIRRSDSHRILTRDRFTCTCRGLEHSWRHGR